MALTHHNLVLNDSCPWKEENIGLEGKYAFFAPHMHVPALPVRDFHLAGPASIGFHMQMRLGDERKMVELLTMAAYMAGWSRFYHLSMQNLDEIVNSEERPSLVYYNLAMKCFGIAFGESQPGRVKWMSPSNINYHEVYLNDKGNVTAVKRHASLHCQHPYRLGRFDDRYSCAANPHPGKAPLNGLVRNQGPHSVVNCQHTFSRKC